VYWEADRTKYDKPAQEATKPAAAKPIPKAEDKMTVDGWKGFWAEIKKMGFSEEEVRFAAGTDSIKDYSRGEVAILFNILKDIKKGDKNNAE